MSLKKIYYHPKLETVLHSLKERLPHAVLLVGANGVGLHTIALEIARRAGLQVTQVLPDEKGSISIDEVRVLYEQSRSKQQKRVIIIDDAEKMTHPAQNALLKLLEEPGEAISFILTSHKPEGLLATIRSRTQRVIVPLLPQDHTEQVLNDQAVLDPSTKSQIMFMAQGKPAEIMRLTADPEHFAAQKLIIRDARDYLQGSSYDRILIIQKYSTDREKAGSLVDAAISILGFSLKAKPLPHMINRLDLLVDIRGKIAENRHVKTQLLRSIF